MASADRFAEIVEDQIPEIINEAITISIKRQTNWSVAIFKNWLKLRYPSGELKSRINPGEEALFQRPKRKFCASDEIRFDRAPLGVNTVGNMMKEISTEAKLSQVYTNHYISATSVTLLDRAGIPVHRIMQVSAHRNDGSVKVFCERQTLPQEKQCSKILAAPVATSTTTSLATQQVQQIEQRNTNEITYQNTFATTGSPKFVDFGNSRFENCNFAFSYNVSKKSD
ncbi:hypothetical protein ACROYT_G029958 [Oculina patagonica]